ncbi:MULTISPECIES: cytochrome C oxidase subunit IV family protein [unclassified Colwellia]|jgi:hypothetical protein|uniref:cytochrome C oxidase subunit IV family protein n=1 Tax=unclassified Colwellia TaxID=196834 RepID=UPI0015F4A1DD|nr:MULTISPECIES: cytochrome C oxidase subunit IV family protein [unclassified Colwellia]MBA6363362.1 cytochrome C oxidase subunit IV family protein [Colwellia sp. BRX8-8]MBA6347395.1 cytochrome C oxidase subunit IV family protein [Colwellia sp. BRX8-9]MBA6350861.1 cytochrome C oxidase subunit IV family protein [Colwellia sp. BRX9-1]MBA6354476.1 cytochrome C oxidase subunit IV family protein [Colwellia sp. BRX8-3]MBA6358257.1 cytochrome C oxidase subunit IV family protein [Colwellia sp. BRX8-6]|tara:strand:- start:1687 stop:1941 length:255 start_codon:yes stop_codon:yes gene_type:complete
MKGIGKLEYYLVVLILITLLNTFLGENFQSTTVVSVLVAITIMCKGIVVIDHFMELKGAHRYLRLMMKTYFVIFPSLIILTVFY